MTLLRDVGRSVGNAVLEGVGRAASRVQESRPVAADLLESDDAYMVVFDAPGARASDVQVRYKDGAVLVRIDRFREHREGFEMRFPGRGLSLDGRVELPDDALVRPDRAIATLRENGTLAIEIPKHDREDVDETDRNEASDVEGATDAGPVAAEGGSDAEDTEE